MRLKIRYKRPTPVRDAVRVLLVPVIAAVLAVASCNASRFEAKGSSWNSPRTTPIEAPVMPRPVARAELQVATVTAPLASSSTRPATSPRPKPEPQPTVLSPKSSPRTGQPTSVDLRVSEPSDLQEQGNFSARTAPVPESIQGDLTPCQRSAAACFDSGGLGTLTDNLDGLSINHETGRFCFSFQEGCERR